MALASWLRSAKHLTAAESNAAQGSDELTTGILSFRLGALLGTSSAAGVSTGGRSILGMLGPPPEFMPSGRERVVQTATSAVAAIITRTPGERCANFRESGPCVPSAEMSPR